MKTKTLALIHTVSWYNKSVIEPFVTPWLRRNPDVRVFNIMDDSLLGGVARQRRRDAGRSSSASSFTSLAAEAMGADVAMCSCTTVGEAVRAARCYASIPVFNIDEPMAREAVQARAAGMGIVATVPTSPAATVRQLKRAAEEAGEDHSDQDRRERKGLRASSERRTRQHDELVHEEMDRLARSVDVLALGQISLAQIKHQTRVPVLQVGHSGLAEARRLLDNGAGNGKSKALRRAPGRTVATCG